MEDLRIKFKLIFIPYLITCFGSISFCAFLYWLFLIRNNAFNVHEDSIVFAVAIIFPGLPILLFLMRRIRLLNLKPNKGSKNWLALYIYVAWISVFIPNILTQQYLQTATGKLTQLNNIAQLNMNYATRYYTAQSYYINKRFAHIKILAYPSGKNHVDFTMEIYSPVPVFDHLFPDTNKITAMRNNADPNVLVLLNDSVSSLTALKRLPADSIRMMRYVNPTMVMPKYGELGKYGALVVMTYRYKLNFKINQPKMAPVAWLAVKYSKTISNSLSQPEKNTIFKQFARESYRDFMWQPLDKFVYLERVYQGSDLKNYNYAINSKGDVDGDRNLILTPVYTPYANKNGQKLKWLLLSIAIGSTIFWLLLMCRPLLHNANLKKYMKPTRYI